MRICEGTERERSSQLHIYACYHKIHHKILPSCLAQSPSNTLYELFCVEGAQPEQARTKVQGGGDQEKFVFFHDKHRLLSLLIAFNVMCTTFFFASLRSSSPDLTNSPIEN